MTENKLPQGRVTYDEWLKTKKYAKVTTVSIFHHTYVVPFYKLQELNPDNEAQDDWLADLVTCEEVEEFSQNHVGECITDTSTITEEEMLKLFDKNNNYLSGWTKEKKIEWVSKLIDAI